jgi:hypothetical protein
MHIHPEQLTAKYAGQFQIYATKRVEEGEELYSMYHRYIGGCTIGV